MISINGIAVQGYTSIVEALLSSDTLLTTMFSILSSTIGDNPLASLPDNNKFIISMCKQL